MGRLADILSGKKQPVIENTKVVTTDEDIKMYNRIWLNKISNEAGYIISSNETKVDGILSALNRKDGHCPCGGSGVQFLCPCKIMREQGICKCGLYENAIDLNPSGATVSATIKK